MQKKAQVLIISLWVLVIVTVIAVGIGHQVSFSLRLSRYQSDKLKALYLAKAAVNRLIIEIDKFEQTDNLESAIETAMASQDILKSISFDNNLDNFATIEGVTDEERKININTANAYLLTALLESNEVNEADELVNNIRIWKGEVADTTKTYETLGYLPKASQFANKEELKLVKGVTPEIFHKLQGRISVYGDGLIDLNTVSLDVLQIFCRGIAKSFSYSDDFADDLAKKIIDSRNNAGGYFKNISEVVIEPTGAEEVNIFNNLLTNANLISNNFLIEVIGNIGKIKSNLAVVYNRQTKKIIFWHEN